MKTQSAYKLGWIGIRCERTGMAWPFLKRQGWMRSTPAQLNNRNAFNFIRPCRTHEEFLALDVKRLASLGMVGIAFWITDAQWGKNAPITDKQWEERRVIE